MQGTKVVYYIGQEQSLCNKVTFDQRYKWNWGLTHIDTRGRKEKSENKCSEIEMYVSLLKKTGD